MIDKKLYCHPKEESSLKDMMDTVSFDDEVMFNYKRYTEKMRQPDLLGKTLKISSDQFGELYQIAASIQPLLGGDLPDMYIYEDYYYGINSKGADKPWIEISAKTVADFSGSELAFLIGREMCRIRLGHTYHETMMNEMLEFMQHTNVVTGMDTVRQTWRAVMYRWSRLSHFTADCFGFAACQELKASIDVIKKSVLNSCYLADRVNLNRFLKQGDGINQLNDDEHQLAKMDEIIPYGPLRIKYLIGYAASDSGLQAHQTAKNILGGHKICC